MHEKKPEYIRPPFNIGNFTVGSDEAAVRDTVKAAAKAACVQTLADHADRLAHFVSRVHEKGLSHGDVVITLINVDTPGGNVLADLLMPGHDWQPFRDTGHIPYARGLAYRDFIQAYLDEQDPEAANKLRPSENLCVVIVDYGVAEVFPIIQP